MPAVCAYVGLALLVLALRGVAAVITAVLGLLRLYDRLQ